MGRWLPWRRAPLDGSPSRDVPAGGQGGVKVVVQQPPGRGVGFAGVVGGGQRAGVLAEQVVELVAARGRAR